MSRFKVGDRLIYFDVWSKQECYVVDIFDGRYGLSFPNLMNDKGEPEYCTSTGERCILIDIYNSPLYKALQE